MVTGGIDISSTAGGVLRLWFADTLHTFVSNSFDDIQL
jgi:hypothetical protein